MSIRTTTNSDFMTGTVLTGAVPMTIISWFRTDALPAASAFSIPWSIDDNNTSFIEPYFDGSAGAILMAVGNFPDTTIISTPAANTWYWVAAVLSPGSPGVIYFSVAGAAPTKVTTGSNCSNPPNANLIVGNDSAHDSTLNGDMAGLIVYDRLLSEQECRAQLGQLSPITKNKLRYYLPMLEKGAPDIPRAGYGAKLTHSGSLGWSAVVPPRPRAKASLRRTIINTSATVTTTTQQPQMFFGSGTTS